MKCEKWGTSFTNHLMSSQSAIPSPVCANGISTIPPVAFTSGICISLELCLSCIFTAMSTTSSCCYLHWPQNRPHKFPTYVNFVPRHLLCYPMTFTVMNGISKIGRQPEEYILRFLHKNSREYKNLSSEGRYVTACIHMKTS